MLISMSNPTLGPFAGPEALQTLMEVLPDASKGGPVELVLDTETTSLTPWVTEKSVLLGNNAPRCRVLSLFLPYCGYQTAVDLDRFTPEEKHILASLLSGHIWVGHNLLFDYQWLLTLNPSVRPGRIVDTMLMVTTLRPEAKYFMQSLVVQHETGQISPRKHYLAFAKRVREMAIGKDKDQRNLRLSDLALWLFDEKLDKSFQLAKNWMSTSLSSNHYNYCMADVDTPKKAARALLEIDLNADISEVLAAINKRKGGPAYRDMEAALHVFVQMQRKGQYWSQTAAVELDDYLEKSVVEAVNKLEKVAPELCEHRNDVLDLHKGVSKKLKEDFDRLFYAETGEHLPLTNAGEPSLASKGLDSLSKNCLLITAWQEVQSAKTIRKRMLEYTQGAETDGRLHPFTGIQAVTGRTTSSNPNMQNIPRDSRFRALFAAPEGHKIIATDFSSIELRIGAALGVRAWRILHFIRTNSQSPQRQRISWILREVPELIPWLDRPNDPIPARIARGTPYPDRNGSEFTMRALAKAHQLCSIVQKIYKASGGIESQLPFRAAYAKGLDPHVLTAIAMEAQGGRFDLLNSTPMKYLESLTQDERVALKKSLKNPRQAAKAVNFGLLYGMAAKTLWTSGKQKYQLDWTEEEAEIAKNAYFDLFPEIDLWHWLQQNAFTAKANILDPYNAEKVRTIEEGGKLYHGNTLSGRPTVSSKMTSGANYQDQGTGAEIAFRALAALPENVQKYLVNFVHDEILLEVPDEQVIEVQAILERTMIEAADSLLLNYGIPTEVESEVGNCWQH